MMDIKKVEAWMDKSGSLYPTLESAQSAYRQQRKSEIIREVFPLNNSNGFLREIALHLPFDQWLIPKFRELVVRLEEEGLI